LRQPLTLERYHQTRPPLPTPQRVLSTTNYVDGPRGALIERACLEAGLELDWIGATTTPTASPERALAAADIVIGLGRSILEAMAAGRAAYVYGRVGGDGWVTPDSYPALEADGFAGTVTRVPVTAERMAAQLRQYEPDMGEANRDLANLHHGARTHAIELVELIAKCGKPAKPTASGVPSARRFSEAQPVASSSHSPPSPLDEIARLLRLEWEMRIRALQSAALADDMRADRDRQRAIGLDAIARVKVLDGELARAHRRVAELEGELRAAWARAGQPDPHLLVLARAWRRRLGARLPEPVRRLRARLRRS
jgi:hypothetical protein